MERRMKELTEEEKIEIIAYGKQWTDSIRKIAKHFNVVKSVIESLYINFERKWKELVELDIDFFKNIDNEYKAYWLGFIYADGSIQDDELEIGLAIKDIEHLIKFKKHISSGHKISERKKTNSCRISVTRTEFVNNLKKHGVEKNKTYKKLLFPSIDSWLYSSFIRGFFDGDGGIEVNWSAVSITSNDLEFIQDIVENKVGIVIWKKGIRSKQNTAAMTIKLYGENMRVFLDYIYLNSMIHLDRKFNDYNKMMLKKPKHRLK